MKKGWVQTMDVLVIDDEPVSRVAVAQTLQSAGYRVTVACNGEEALARLTQENLQLIVCDWSMPGMNGLQLCRAIRSTILRRYVYIHGAPDEDAMGVPGSRGCIKMRNADLVRLYDLVPVGTRVHIIAD